MSLYLLLLSYPPSLPQFKPCVPFPGHHTGALTFLCLWASFGPFLHIGCRFNSYDRIFLFCVFHMMKSKPLT